MANRKLDQEKISLLRDKILEVDLISHNANLLAINATIEVIHANELLSAFEQVVTSNLLIQSCILAEILQYASDFSTQNQVEFGEKFGIEEFYITDQDGLIEHTNMQELIGEPIPNMDLLKILENPQLQIALPSTENPVTKKQYKVIAISRRDKPGIIQLASSYVGAAGQTAINGFGAVTDEAKRLADLINQISAKILEYTKSIASLQDETDSYSDNQQIDNYTKSILSLTNDLYNIARQTNLLGINASIEAAHSSNEKQDFDNLLDLYMTSEAKLAAHLVYSRPGITCQDMVGVSACSGIGEFWITDENGVVELTNFEGGKGFRFTNDGQTAPYMKILTDPGLVVTAPPSRRALDNRIYKFAAVARLDKKGIFQIGIPSKMYGDSTTKGFAEVAKQIKSLSEGLKKAADEIDGLLR